MTDQEKPENAAKEFPKIENGLSRAEIMDVLADEGYPAGGRKGWLKKVLTRLAKEQQENPNQSRAELVSEIKNILDDNISGDPKADDTL